MTTADLSQAQGLMVFLANFEPQHQQAGPQQRVQDALLLLLQIVDQQLQAHLRQF